MLVHVKTGLLPQSAPEITEGERQGVCARAMMLGYDAWYAQVQIDRQGGLVGEIRWMKLK